MLQDGYQPFGVIPIMIKICDPRLIEVIEKELRIQKQGKSDEKRTRSHPEEKGQYSRLKTHFQMQPNQIQNVISVIQMKPT